MVYQRVETVVVVQKIQTCTNRLLVLGTRRRVEQFASAVDLPGRFPEFLEFSPGRYHRSFESDSPPLNWVQTTSAAWPLIVLLLDYEDEVHRTKGLAKGKAGRLEHHWVTY